MGINFPPAPVVGQVYPDPPIAGVPHYKWDGTVWVAELENQLHYVKRTGDTMQGALTLAQDPATAMHAVTKQYVDNHPIMRNRIVNGAMQVSQENGNSAGTASGYYSVDQFFLAFSATGTFTTQRVQVVTPRGSKDRVRVTITVADAALAASDNLYLRQNIEGNDIADFRYGSASARQSILRFGWKSPAGTYSLAIYNSAVNRSYIANFTISAGQANTDTEQTLIIPGDTTGTWLTDTGVGMYLNVVLATGSTYHGAAGWQAGTIFGTSSNTNGMATAGSVFELFDVGLYLDIDNTGVAPKWEMPDPVQELARCQRYFQSYIGLIIADVVNGANTAYEAISLRTVMRAVPTLTFSTPSYANSNTLVMNGASAEAVRLQINIPAAGSGWAIFNMNAIARM